MTDEKLDAMNKLVQDGMFERIPVDPPLWRFTKKGQDLNIERVAFGATLMLQQMMEHMGKVVDDTREALFRIHNNIPFGIEEFIDDADDDDNEDRPAQLSFEMEQEQDEPQGPVHEQTKFQGRYL